MCLPGSKAQVIRCIWRQSALQGKQGIPACLVKLCSSEMDKGEGEEKGFP